MGETTQDPHNQKEHIEVWKNVKSGNNRADTEQDTAI